MIPLLYIPHGKWILLVASAGGAPSHPAWYHNLIKHPNIEVEHRGNRRKFRARLAEGAEKYTLWPICYRHYAPYEKYRMRTMRDIPIFVCEPNTYE
jgi:deazaflavin-dependent oxidoreductase (nitroreductase family)